MKHIETIENELVQILNRLYPNRLAQIILYGSYARGDFHVDSDIDFLVVLEDEEILTGKELGFMNKPIFDLTLQYGIQISHYPTTQKKFTQSESMFYRQIRKEGKVLWKKK